MMWSDCSPTPAFIGEVQLFLVALAMEILSDKNVANEKQNMCFVSVKRNLSYVKAYEKVFVCLCTWLAAVLLTSVTVAEV